MTISELPTTNYGRAKTTDALGVLPDASYNELDADIREVLVVGRPIAAA